MDIINIFNKVKRDLSPINTDIKIASKNTIIFCRFIFDDCDLRVSLNFNDYKMYIYYVDAKKSNDDIISILNGIERKDYDISGYVIFFDIKKIDDNEIASLFIDCINTVDFYVSGRTSTKIRVKGKSIDLNKNIVKAPNNLKNCDVSFQGESNLLVIHDNPHLKALFIEFVGTNGIVEIGRNSSFSGHLKVGHNCKIKIGDYVSSTNKVYMTCAESTQIDIGDDCMFATNNQIRTDDAHAIYDSKTGKRVNHSSNIIIGKHVWVGYNATILGGSKIGDGSIVGMGAIVKKKFPNNCVIAGIPAKIIRKDIFWQRPNVVHFDESQGEEVVDFEKLSYCNSTTE